jgi:G3E family GTPase
LDATLYLKVGHNLPIINHQLEESDVILLNKVDLLEAEQISSLRERLRRFSRDQKAVYETVFSKIAYERVFPGLMDTASRKKLPFDNYEKESNQRHPGKDHERSGLHTPLDQGDHSDSTAEFGTISITTKKVWPLRRIEKLLSMHRDRIIRAKGVLKTDVGNKLFQLSTSGIEIEDYPKSIPRSELVLIFKEENREFLEPSFNDLL